MQVREKTDSEPLNKSRERALLDEIESLKAEIHQLRQGQGPAGSSKTVSVPEAFQPLFDEAEKTVGRYFHELNMDPSRGTIEISGQRYVLVRASALSHEFLCTFRELYADRGDQEAFLIGRNFLFDISHVIGMDDAKSFHAKMQLEDPIAKLSAGPVHFAYSGWAYVDILPESHPSPDDNFFLKYHHPYSFEADSWVRSGKKADFPVCTMNSGYSSGWCEQSFGIPLTAVEICCRAQGDENCTFVMAPPHKIFEYLKKQDPAFMRRIKGGKGYEIPTFFERKILEEKLIRQAREDTLTRLLNRGAILETLEKETIRSIREKTHLGLIMVDLDHFRDINNRMGYLAGDAALKEVAHRIQSKVKEGEFVGRYGGEEFMIILPDCNQPYATHLAQKILEAIEGEPIRTSHGDISLRAHCGVIATDNLTLNSMDTFINQVDAELNFAKSQQHLPQNPFASSRAEFKDTEGDATSRNARRRHPDPTSDPGASKIH